MTPEANSLLAALWLCGACPLESVDAEAVLELYEDGLVRFSGAAGHLTQVMPTVLGKQSARCRNLRIEVTL